MAWTWREESRGVAVSSQVVWLSCGDDEAEAKGGESFSWRYWREDWRSRLEVLLRDVWRGETFQRAMMMMSDRYR